MRARSSSEIVSLKEAFGLLGLEGPVEAAVLDRAFRQAAKTARPDMDGGDALRFRRVIAAWRLIQAEGMALTALPAPKAPPYPKPVVPLSPLEALHGGIVQLAVASRRFRIRVPAGMRTGDHLRLAGADRNGADLYLPVLIRPGSGLTVVGDDIYMNWTIDRRVLRDGGRLDIATHGGMRTAWVVRDMAQPVRLRLRDLGLPARGRRKAGHLFVKLDPVEGCPSASEDLLARFTKVWTPRRLAA